MPRRLDQSSIRGPLPARSALLCVRELTVALRVGGRLSRPVDGVSFEIGAGQTVGLVGESGCGKSLCALALLRLLPPVARIVHGEVLLDGVDLTTLPGPRLRQIRGHRIAMVFQEPTSSLNPVYTCGEQIAEGLRLHLRVGRRAAWDRAVELLDEVRIPDPNRRARQYPHELSGGMRQRVMIAMAIACGPELLIADEPTTALDVTIQRDILELLDDLRRRRSMAMLHITHDLALIAERAHTILVMYAGRVVEVAEVDQLFARPAHPYTLGLLACRPKLGRRQARLPSIPGKVPEPGDRPGGCSFHPRCPFATERCQSEEPPLLELSTGHRSACWELERVLAEGRWPS